MNDSLEDFETPKAKKRQPLGELSVNTLTNLSHPSRQSESSKTGTRNIGVQCVAKCKEQFTQLGSESSVSYAGKLKDADEGDKITYRSLLMYVIPNKDAALDFCFNMEIIPRLRKCPTCGNPMSLIKDSKVSDQHRWYCRIKKGPQKHEHRLSIRTGTFFEKSNMTIEEILQIIYMWIHGHSQKNIQHEQGISSATDVDWCSFCREVCEVSIINSSEKIGGPGIVVEIDESKFAKRKYNVGHRVKGGWVFGGREKEDKRKVFMEAVENRTAETLLAVIQKWIAPGSVIWSDCWKSYDRIPQLPEGYTHLTVNHSKHFVDPESGTCTNRIESDWRHAKAEFPQFGTKPELYAGYLAVFMWKRRHYDNDLFTSFLKDVARVYPGTK